MLQNFKELVDSILKRRDKGLKQQWLEHYDLPPRETRADLPKTIKGNLYQQWVEEGSLAPENAATEQVINSVVQNSTDSLLVKRLIKYIIVEGVVIVILLVALAVVATMLAVKAG